MSQMPVVMGNGQPPVLPQDMMAQYQAMVAGMNEGVGASYNFIRPGKLDFTFVENGVKRQVPNGQVAGVLLAVSPVETCTWYEKAYNPGQEPEMPDLVWNWPDHSKFPDALPQQYRQKIMQNGKERWAFRVARRSVWALAGVVDGQLTLNLDSPYIMDITSMSLYGKSDPNINSYKYNGLMSMCQRLSQPPHFICSPAMFLTGIKLDAASPVSGVVTFSPQIVNNQLAYLDSDTFQRVLQLMLSQQVKDMLKVQEKLEWGSATNSATTTQATTTAATAPAQTATVTAPPTKATASAQSVISSPSTESGSAPVNAAQMAYAPTQSSVAQPTAPQPTPAPNEDLLAQAQAAMSAFDSQGAALVQPGQPVQPAGIPVAQGVNPTTAQAIGALDSII